LEYVLPDGSKALRFDQIEFAAFEMHILKRPGAEAGYTLDKFRKHLELYKDIDKAKLRENFAVFLKAII
ncbi:mannonate dehydratase, partial [Escherichia coli]|uniref:mannonate dehydratase n=1 Tax=Escherichia coli TaxID=562 RepID=UPI003EDF85F7